MLKSGTSYVWSHSVLGLIIIILIVFLIILFWWNILSSVDIVLIFYVSTLTAEGQKLLQRHYLIVILNFWFAENSVSHHGIACILSQFSDFLCYGGHFLSIILINKESPLFLLCVAVHLWAAILRWSQDLYSPSIRVYIVKDLIIVNRLSILVLYYLFGSSLSFDSGERPGLDGWDTLSSSWRWFDKLSSS